MKKRHKYLKRIGVSKKDIPYAKSVNGCKQRFKDQRRKYGFDERDIENFDTTLAMFAYERIAFFVTHYMENDLDHLTVEYKGETYTVAKAIKKVLKGLREIINNGINCSADIIDCTETSAETWGLYGLIAPYIWL